MSNLVWFCGAPGSKWSSVANVITSIDKLKFNLSDHDSQRTFTHSYGQAFDGIQHTGAYFGPGNALGNSFDQLNEIPKEEVENEIKSAWKTTNGRLLVKGHVFTNHLDYIKDTWPNSTIIMVFRAAESCVAGWNVAGGFDIQYPNYDFYKGKDQLKEVKRHNLQIRNFCKENNIPLDFFNTKYLNQKFKWNIDSIVNEEEKIKLKKYLTHIENKRGQRAIVNDVHIGIWNLKGLLNDIQ
jgi:hypothetical protein